MNWYIGQEVIIIVNGSLNPAFKKGTIHTILGIAKSQCRCRSLKFDLGNRCIADSIKCENCGSIKMANYGDVLWFDEKDIAPLDVNISADILKQPMLA